MSTSQRFLRILTSLESAAVLPTTAEVADNENEMTLNHGGNKSKRPRIDSVGSSILLQSIGRMKKRRNYELKHPVAAVQRENDNHGTATTAKTTANVVVRKTAVSSSSDDPSTKDITNDDDNSNDGDINIIKSIQELRNVYIYGLITVSKLQDLRDAPDAILPGNFCDYR